MPSPLPSSKWPEGGEIDSVYCQLVQMEKTILSELEHAAKLKKKTPETVTKLIHVRVVGHLMHVAPPPWCDRLAEGFASAEWDITILQVADSYINLLFRLLRTDHHHTPATDSHPSRPFFDLQRQEIQQLLREPPSSHIGAKKRALLRDGYRCVLTGRVDFVSKRAGLPISPGSPVACFTQCCHIFSRTANAKFIDVDEGKREYAASAWALLDRMAPEFKGFYKELNGAGIHRLENVMTMQGDMPTFFDRMDIWLEHKGGENSDTYRVCYPDGMKSDMGGYGISDTITFSTPDADTLPVPAPRYLELHAVCARVADLSGAAEYVLDVLDRVESGDTVVLAEDGSDAHVLDTLLAVADIYGASTQARWDPCG